MRLIRLPLLSARALKTRPAYIPASRPRAAAKKAGLRYEIEVATALQALAPQHGRWFEYLDGGGRGYCQTDIILAWKGRVIVLECKYTWTSVARQQLDLLYRPIVEKVTNRESVGIVVCKKLVPEIQLDSICHSLEEAIEASAHSSPVLHWIGQGKLAG